MSASFIIFIIIQIVALAYFVELLRRTAMRTREYPLEETHETLPFQNIRLRHVVIFYIITYITWIGFSIWLYVVFIDSSLIPASQPANSARDVILDL
ncbi:hypothetical protein JW758_03090 [Candidatus Peregrinibacteria bacterium]|nr:hypothetical protein [Candidatus Peregrinibacteria bacterium]